MDRMSSDENLFWELLELSDAVLFVDNDMCYVEYNEEDHQSFDFGPEELVRLMAEKLEIEVRSV
jgi:hypothetical protein